MVAIFARVELSIVGLNVFLSAGVYEFFVADVTEDV
jgi:hypothetical protein